MALEGICAGCCRNCGVSDGYVFCDMTFSYRVRRVVLGFNVDPVVDCPDYRKDHPVVEQETIFDCLEGGRFA